MSNQHICPFCGSTLLCQISLGKLAWYCRRCHLEIPYGICHDLEDNTDEPREQANLIDQINHSQSQYLKTILQTIVKKIRQALDVERVMIWKYSAKGELAVLEESVVKNYTSMKDWRVGHFLSREDLTEFSQGKIVISENLQVDDHQKNQGNLLESFFQVKAKLVAPILIPDDDQKNSRLWGLIIVHQCSKKRQWQTGEIQLFSLITQQLAFNIKQLEKNKKLEIGYKKIEALTCIDKVTGLAQRCKLDACLDQEWRRMARQKQYLSLIMCEIDGFKKYQYTFGHQAAENCLKKIGKIINQTIKRPGDLAIRYGEAKFIFILPNTDGVGAVKVAQRLRVKVKELAILAGKTSKNNYITISLGVASNIPQEGINANMLLLNTQEALEQARKAGGDRVMFEHLDSLEAIEKLAEKPIKDNPWEHLSNPEQLLSYVAYFISRGKIIISPIAGPLYFQGLVYQYQGYHPDFLSFWQKLNARKDFPELYLQGDKHSFRKFLEGKVSIGECARCNLLIPIPTGAAYDIPSCDLCEHNGHHISIMRVIAIAQPFSQAINLQKLCAVNQVCVTFISHPDDLVPEILTQPLDLVLINSQIPPSLAQRWAKQLHKIPQLEKIPIIALSKQAGNGISPLTSDKELENYLLNPLNGKHLASYLRALLSQANCQNGQCELTWFPG